ncbi:hemolysin family protein [Haloglycomyces albus]|uniref:hemolysin family protein n=1 Tax=Haloglycomyces albus TaxID=526067 RepID=UPI0004BC1839|nr:hemolysin family protein [Haloglycomyces albus]
MTLQWGLIATAVALTVVAGIAAMVDSAFNEVSPARTAELKEQHRRGANSLVTVITRLPAHLNVLIFLRVASEVTATALVAVVTFSHISSTAAAVALTAAVMTFMSFVAIGVGPRTIGRQHAYPVALAAAGPVNLLTRVLRPLSKFLIVLGNAITPGKGFKEGPFTTSAVEIREMVDQAEAHGTVDNEESEMIKSVFELGDTVARGVMVPRTSMVWVNAEASVDDALAAALDSGYSRIPVVGEDLDDIRGVAYLKDLAQINGGGRSITTTMREVTFVPESKPVDDLLREMQAKQIHIAIVVDEYGGVAGLVTIEDIIEEIVGEITDEYDDELPPITWSDDGSARVIARLNLDELATEFKVDFGDVDVDTVGGLIASELGKLPVAGDRVIIAGLEMTAEGAIGRRRHIETVHVKRVPTAPTDPSELEESSSIHV